MTIHTLTKEQKAARLSPLDGLRLYSLAELERTLGICHRTLQTYITGGFIKATKIGGRWKVTEEEVRRIVTEGTHNTNDKRRKPAGNKPKPKAAATSTRGE